jgi:phosphatidylinositol glycan class N
MVHGVKPNSHYIHRLVVLFLQCAPTFIILTISYEGLFYFAFCLCLFTWVRMEHHVYAHRQSGQPTSAALSSANPLKAVMQPTATPSVPSEKPQYRALTLADARIALFFIYLLQSAFFSTGNIASVSSFSLDAVARLIPVFDPFSQGALLLLKIMIPFGILSANLGLLNRRLGVAPSALFMVVMAVTDVLTLNFFYMVRDEGSWLDIGTSISHFVIASLLGVFVAGLELVSGWLVGEVRFGDEREVVRDSGSGEANGGADSVEGVGIGNGNAHVQVGPR